MKHYMDASKIHVIKYYMHASIISKKKQPTITDMP